MKPPAHSIGDGLYFIAENTTLKPHESFQPVKWHFQASEPILEFKFIGMEIVLNKSTCWYSILSYWSSLTVNIGHNFIVLKRFHVLKQQNKHRKS